MQNLKYIPLICMLFLGCTKAEKDNEPLCQSPPCSNYLQTWEDLMKEQNHLSDAYLDNHFKITSSEIIQHQNGEQFVIHYLFSIEWAEVKVRDAFMVKISENGNVYPGQHLNRGKFLDADEVEALIRYGNFDSYISEITAADHLSFSSAHEALDAIRQEAKTQELFFDHVGFKESKGGYKSNGHPFLFCHGKEDPISKTRLDGEIDLVNKIISTYPTQVENKTFTPLKP